MVVIEVLDCMLLFKLLRILLVWYLACLIFWSNSCPRSLKIQLKAKQKIEKAKKIRIASD